MFALQKLVIVPIEDFALSHGKAVSHLDLDRFAPIHTCVDLANQFIQLRGAGNHVEITF
jgi:hypothetical protein